MKIAMRLNRKGVTLLEVVLSAGLLTIVGMMLSSWISRPAGVQKTMLDVDMKRQADSAINQFASDLQSADPASIQWLGLPPTSPLNFSTPMAFKIPQFNYAAGTAAPALPVIYKIQATGNGFGDLIRSYNGVDRVLLTNVVAPSQALPLVEQDTTSINGITLYNMLIINLSYQPPASTKPMTVLRRVAVTG